MSEHYILDGKNPVPADLMTWAKWIDDPKKRRVALDEKNGVRVSTVFLGLDHSFGGAVPLLFETMIFGGEHDEHQERCTTWEQAEAMHKTACELAFGKDA